MDEFMERVTQWKRTVHGERVRKEARDDTRMWPIWLIALAAVGILFSALGAYAWFLHAPISIKDSNWANFGSYLGGAAGPPLSFLSILALLITIRQQARVQIAALGRSRAEQHVRALDGYLADLQRMESAQVTAGVLFEEILAGYDPKWTAKQEAKQDAKTEVETKNREEFGDPTAVEQEIEPEVERYNRRLRGLLRRYTETLVRYSEMVAMYRNNNGYPWDLALYVDRGNYALNQLRRFDGAVNWQFLKIVELNLTDGWEKQ